MEYRCAQPKWILQLNKFKSLPWFSSPKVHLILWNRHKLVFYASNFSTWTEKQILTTVSDRPWFKLTDERDKCHQQCHYAHHTWQKGSFLHLVVDSLWLSSHRQLPSICDSHTRTNCMTCSRIVLARRLADDILKIKQQGCLGLSSMTQSSGNQWNPWRSVATPARAALRHVEHDLSSSNVLRMWFMLLFLNTRQFPHANCFLSELIWPSAPRSDSSLSKWKITEKEEKKKKGIGFTGIENGDSWTLQSLVIGR